MGTITISIEEYKNLLELQVRASMFKEHVRMSEFSIPREECAAYLGFDLKGGR